MGYQITTFDGTTLPSALGISGSMDLSSGEALSPSLPLVGGRVYDVWGSSQSPRPMVRLSYACLLTGTEATMQTALNTWYGKVGKRGSLVRTGGDATTHSTTARLVSIDITRGRGHKHHLPLTMKFDALALPWRGTVRGTSDAVPGGGILTVAQVNSGNVAWLAPTITITAPAGGSITVADIVYAAGNVHLVWTGTLAASKALVIDCGVMSVHNDGADAYAGLTFGAGHTVDEWWNVLAGSNNLVVTLTGAGAVGALVTTVFYDGWA